MADPRPCLVGLRQGGVDVRLMVDAVGSLFQFHRALGPLARQAAEAVCATGWLNCWAGVSEDGYSVSALSFRTVRQQFSNLDQGRVVGDESAFDVKAGKAHLFR